MEKRYFWLKLQSDFFQSLRIKKLRKLAGGDTYTIIYLKMQLLSIKTDGILTYTGVEEDLADEIALDIDEDPENVKVFLQYGLSCGLVENVDASHVYLPFAAANVGKEGASTQRVREFRERQGKTPALEAKTNAERQQAFRAKKAVENNPHVPYIEDYSNRTRYGGNYYIVFKRDGCKCAMCGSTDNLCVHHIDGYYVDKPENNEQNKMITLCRSCHSAVHNGKKIPDELLKSIEYTCSSNESNEFCNADVTLRNENGNGEIDKEIEIDKEKYIKRNVTPVTVENVDNSALDDPDDSESVPGQNRPIKITRTSRPSSFAEVSAYIQQRAPGTDIRPFWNYWSAKGWAKDGFIIDWRKLADDWLLSMDVLQNKPYETQDLNAIVDDLTRKVSPG